MEYIEYEGWKDCVRLSNGDAELVATTAFGPRIIHYGRTDGPNAFHVISETRGRIQSGQWYPYGGHRLWHAPEVMPRTYQADNGPVEAALLGGTLSLRNHEPATGLTREMRLTLAPRGTAVRVEHRLTNTGAWDVTLSAWALSIVANGGRVVIPQEPFVSHDDDLAPARPLVLWKFTDMADPRWRWGRKYLSLRQAGDTQGNPQKVGMYNAQGWAAHLTPEQAFVISIDVAPGGPSVLPDDGCNCETYTDGPFQELETLGPLQTLPPGHTATHVEHWFLAPTGEIADDDGALDAHLLPLVGQARREFAALK